MNSLAEQLTKQFYLWEQRGRGWQVWNAPVELEPPFITFSYRSVHSSPVFDDGRKPTFLSSLVESFSSQPRSEQTTFDPDIESAYFIPPIPFTDSSPICELKLSLPPQTKITTDQIDQFLLSLSDCSSPVSFEIMGSSDRIVVQFACRESGVVQVKQVLKSYFPEAVIEVEPNTLGKGLTSAKEYVVVDFGLSEEFMRPLKTFSYLDPDPLISVVGALEGLQKGETGLLQVLFQSTRFPWTESILRSVSDGSGGSFFADAPEMVQLAHEKTKRPLFAAVIRLVGVGDSTERAWEIARRLASALVQVAEPQSNELIPLTNDEYDNEIHLANVVQRQTHRSGMLLNCRELGALVHPPSASVQSPKLRREITKTKQAPSLAIGHELILGENIHQGTRTVVSLSPEQRLRHVYMIGATGTGKSTLLLNMIIQDITKGNGVAVVDPHGDLIDEIMEYIPESRYNDVVLFDPADTEYPVGLNILSAHSDIERNVLASDLVSAFKRLSTSWGDQMTSVLGNAIQAFLESEEGGTLVELRTFLLDRTYREKLLTTVKDEEVRYFWKQAFPLLRGNTQSSILTRLDAFLRPKLIRNIVSQKTGLDIEAILNDKKIFLVKLAQGLIGEENASLLGTLIISKLNQTAMARQVKRSTERENFYLYIDEFPNFITPSLSGILSGARKYSLGLVLSHQELEQLKRQDAEIMNSVISNPGTRICFRLGDFDAKKLQDGFVNFDAQDLQNLGIGEAIARVERSEYDFNLKTFTPPIVTTEVAEEKQKELINLSRKRYGRAKEEHPTVSVQPEQQKVWPPPQEELKKPEEPKNVAVREKPTEVQVVHVEEPSKEEKNLTQHRYLQTLIKRMAEERGYKAVIEEPTPVGAGRVDVGLERNGEKIACEIAVTTSDEHELQNIKKCLSAGYNKVIVCAPEKKRLEKLSLLITKRLNTDDQTKVLFFEPEALFSHMEEQTAKEMNTEERVKGYRVKVQYQAVNEQERKNKRESVANVILKSIKRLKE